MKIVFDPNYLARMGHVRAIRIFDRDHGPFNAELTWPNGTPFIMGDYLSEGLAQSKVDEAANFIVDLARLLGLRVIFEFADPLPLNTLGGFSIPEWDLCL